MSASILKTTQNTKINTSVARPFSPTAGFFFLPKPHFLQQDKVNESQAGNVGENAMRKTAGGNIKPSFFKSSVLPLQRKCAACEEKEEKIQRKESPGEGSGTASATLENDISKLKGGGQSLSTDERNFYEPRFGYDFSNVKLHTDSSAVNSAKSINALAYTTGNNIVFNQGQYAPGTDSGKKLLGHELTHVVQQGSVVQPCIQRFEGWEHQYFGDQGLHDLHDFLGGSEGVAWASQYGYNAQQLIASIQGDQFYNGGRLRTQNASITPGEAVSLSGDFYESWQNLQNAPSAELRGTSNPDGSRRSEGILDVMSREENHTISSAGATIAYSNITGGRYLDMAKRNRTHFSPDNRAEWQRLHTIAKQMVADHPGDAQALNQALLVDSSGGHFLTDAFAAGHLINRAEVLAQIHLYLVSHPVQAANPEMQAFVALAAQQGAIDQLILKLIHDHFNATGLDVINNKGMRWKTFGDNHLRSATETQHIGSLAVFLSRLQVINAAAGGSQHSDSEVLDLLPSDASLQSANQQAIAYISIAAGNVDSIMMSNRQAAEAALNPFLAPVARFYMNTIDQRANALDPIPGQEGLGRSLLVPSIHIGADFNPWVTHAGPERNISFGAVLGVEPATQDQGTGLQAGAYATYRFP